MVAMLCVIRSESQPAGGGRVPAEVGGGGGEAPIKQRNKDRNAQCAVNHRPSSSIHHSPASASSGEESST